MYIASFLPKHVIPTRFADDVTSTSGATRLAFDLLPLASSDAYPVGEEKRQAHRTSFLGQAAACRNVCGPGRWAKRRGRLRTGHREAAAGLPAAEEGLRAGPVGL